MCETKEFIKETLVEMHRTATTDKYGQLSQFNFSPRLFGDRVEEVESYCKENRGVLHFSTYGGRSGKYRAFNILDQDIIEACRQAFKQNENRFRNLNSW